MKLLIVTQKVDSSDPILGFFHRWIEEFAKTVEQVTVICLEEGIHDLPGNVRVYSLGKEKGTSKLGYILNFYKFIISLRNEYDSVFVHMNQIYVILGGLLWKIWHNKIGLWYVHRQVTASLTLAEKITDVIFTSSKESFALPSPKVQYMGHGIDSSKFVCDVSAQRSTALTVVHVGRITAIKNLETLVVAIDVLKQTNGNAAAHIVGGTSNEKDDMYLEDLKGDISKRGLESNVFFKGNVVNSEIAKVYCEASVSVNMAPTGGWDKSVLESIMSSCPVFVSNAGFKPVFGKYSDLFMFKQGDGNDLAEKIQQFMVRDDTAEVMIKLRESVVAHYDLPNLIKNITDKLTTTK